MSTASELRRVERGRAALLGVGAAVLLVVSVVVLAAPVLVGDGVARRFGQPEVDRSIDAAPASLTGDLMSVDPRGDGTALVSYEYYDEGDLFVGYSVVPLERIAGRGLLDPIEIEIAAPNPQLSRLAGTRAAPLGWVTSAYRGVVAVGRPLAALGSLLGLAAGALAIRVWVGARRRDAPEATDPE